MTIKVLGPYFNVKVGRLSPPFMSERTVISFRQRHRAMRIGEHPLVDDCSTNFVARDAGRSLPFKLTPQQKHTFLC